MRAGALAAAALAAIVAGCGAAEEPPPDNSELAERIENVSEIRPRPKLEAPGPSLIAITREDVAATLEPGDRFLVTADLVKPGDVLEAAYNDPPGATAQARFRLNQLAHFNRTFDGDARPHLFYPRARWDPETSAVVGHLFATEDQTVTFRGLDHTLDLPRGDSLVHGYSVKFGRPEFVAEAAAAGFDLDREWIDAVWQYGLFLFERR